MLSIKFSGVIKINPDCSGCQYLKGYRPARIWNCLPEDADPGDAGECSSDDIVNDCPHAEKAIEKISAEHIDTYEAEVC